MPSRARGRVETWPTFGEAAARGRVPRASPASCAGFATGFKCSQNSRGFADSHRSRIASSARSVAGSKTPRPIARLKKLAGMRGASSRVAPAMVSVRRSNAGRCRGVGVDHCARLDRVREAAAFVGIELHAGFVAGSVRPRLPRPSVAAFTSRVSSIAPKRCDSASSKPTSPMKRSGLRNVPQSMSQIGRSL